MRHSLKITRFLFALSFVLLQFGAFAQPPRNIPYESDPIDFGYWPNIVIFIVIPAILIVFFILWRKGRGGRRV